MSHTVKKKHNFADLDLLRQVCEGIKGVTVMTVDQHLATSKWARLRGPKDSCRAVIRMPNGWVDSTVEVHDSGLYFDGDNERNHSAMESLYAIKRAYSKEVVLRMEESFRMRADVEQQVFQGEIGTMFTFEGRF